jgi:hypothetical protein
MCFEYVSDRDRPPSFETLTGEVTDEPVGVLCGYDALKIECGLHHLQRYTCDVKMMIVRLIELNLL